MWRLNREMVFDNWVASVSHGSQGLNRYARFHRKPTNGILPPPAFDEFLATAGSRPLPGPTELSPILLRFDEFLATAGSRPLPGPTELSPILLRIDRHRYLLEFAFFSFTLLALSGQTCPDNRRGGCVINAFRGFSVLTHVVVCILDTSSSYRLRLFTTGTKSVVWDM